tara:strand:+ start:1334 stop:1924 length:591 start_codon:yes stop_codon:yes gene_type:complete
MTDYEAYHQYLALQLHFGGKGYDYFKYNGKTNATPQAFEKRKDKFKFGKLTRKLSDDQIVEYFVANLIRGKKWIGDFNQRSWIQHKKIVQSVEYNFANDLEKLLTNVNNFDILFHCDNGNHPKLVKAYLGKKISLETLVILEKMLHYRKKFDTHIKETYVWPEVSMLIGKYAPFLPIDNDKFKKMTFSKVKELLYE